MEICCLFCEARIGDYVARGAGDKFPCRAIYPKQVQHRRSRKKKGGMEDVVHPLLPGYVFLYFDTEEGLDFLSRGDSMQQLARLDGVIRVLSYSDASPLLSGEDARFARMLLEKNGVIGKTLVYQEGDRIRLTSGAFEGLSTRILKVDRRCSRMQIEIPFARQYIKTWVEYEIVEPDPESVRKTET